MRSRSPVPLPRSPAGRMVLQRRVRQRIREFDAGALLDLLDHMGYTPDDIAYRGHMSLAPQPTLIHDIRFLDDGQDPRVRPDDFDLERLSGEPGDDSDLKEVPAAVVGGGEAKMEMSLDIDGDMAIDIDIDMDIDIDVPRDIEEVTAVRAGPIPGPDPYAAPALGPYDGAAGLEPWSQSRAPTLDTALDDTAVFLPRARPDTLIDETIGNIQSVVASDAPRAEQMADVPAWLAADRFHSPLAGYRLSPLLSEHPRARVVITVNLGMISCRSPLPSYFGRLFQRVDTREPLLELLAFVDHHLLRGRLTSDHPRRWSPSWATASRDVVRLSNLGSAIGLDWLFRHVFPELGVSVSRTSTDHQMPTTAARLGYAVLGGAAFGAVTTIPIFDFEVTLRCAEATSPAGVPWINEGPARLAARALPLLADSCMHLTVAMLFVNQRTYARIADDSYVGYDPLRGGADRPRRVVLFQGALAGGVEQSAAAPGLDDLATSAQERGDAR